MSASTRDLERAAQVQFVRAQKAEQKAENIQHALNLMLNLGFERFHTALTMDGAVHEFELGTVRNLPAPDEIDCVDRTEENTQPANRPLANHFPRKVPLCIGIPRCRVQIPAKAP